MGDEQVSTDIASVPSAWFFRYRRTGEHDNGVNEYTAKAESMVKARALADALARHDNCGEFISHAPCPEGRCHVQGEQGVEMRASYSAARWKEIDEGR